MADISLSCSSGADTAGPPVWMRIGALDQRAVLQTRQVLRLAGGRPDTILVVDLAGLDGEHELTMFALLVETVRLMAGRGGRVTVLHPPERLADRLVGSGVRVIRFGPPPQRPPGTLTVDIGGALQAR